MSAGKHSLILDSSAVVAHFKRDDTVKAKLAHADLLYLPLTAYAELRYGALNAENPAKKLEDLSEFMQIVTVLYPSQATAGVYAEERLKLRKMGKPIPESDLWIAALAIQYRLRLLTSDKKHFSLIESLELDLFSR